MALVRAYVPQSGTLPRIGTSLPGFPSPANPPVWPQPSPDVVRNGNQAGVVDSLPVSCGDTGVDVPHDAAHGREVATPFGNRLEPMPQGVESPTTIEVHGAYQLAEVPRDRIDVSRQSGFGFRLDCGEAIPDNRLPGR